MSERPIVVEAVGVSKKFRMAKERTNTLKATVLNLHKRNRLEVEDFWALRDVSFAVHEGETFGLIGENGSGKSTMLKLLTRIMKPDSGEVRVEGKVSALLELGAGFHPELSGRENVYLNGAILGLSQKELRTRFDEIVDFAGVEEFIDEPVKNYSSGMYVRLGFSVAINVDPDVLFVDEVLAVGDEAFQRKCMEKFTDLRNAGKTIILVSHGLSAIENLCDRVAWFSHGRLVNIGTARNVVQAYTDTVHVGRHIDEFGRPRWGSGEGRITGVFFIDEAGRPLPASSLRTGDRARLRLEYQCKEPLERPVFGISIRTLEGVEISAPTSHDVGLVPEVLSGNGSIDIEFDRMLLLPGAYDLSVSLLDYKRMHEYDVRRDLIRFDVERGDVYEQTGVVSLGGRWSMSSLDGVPSAT